MTTPAETWKDLQRSAVKSVKTSFPIDGQNRKLVLNDVIIDQRSAEAGDIRGQEKAKLSNRTWGAGVYGDVSLVDKKTGKVIDRSKVKLFTLPRPTDRYSYIVGGNERQVNQLWRLRPGVYSQIKANGDLETEFAMSKPFARESRLKVPFSPKTKGFKLRWGTQNVPLYSILKTLGVQDEEMKKIWGPDIYKANVTTKTEGNIKQLYSKISQRGVKAKGEKYDDIASAVVEEFGKTELLPDTTMRTLGKPYKSVTGDALLQASKRILDVARGDQPPDDRDSLVFKKLTSVDDFLLERIGKNLTQREINRKVGNNINRKDRVREIVSGDLFGKHVDHVFTRSSLSDNPEQINPLEMLSNHRATTILGGEEGGIKSERTLSRSMKLINPSHMGFLDPIHTPESKRTGISLNLPMGVVKDGEDIKALVYDLKEKKFRKGKSGVTPAELHSEYVLLPDQVTWDKDKGPKPIGPTVKMKDPKTGDVVQQPFKKARYLFVSPHQLFDEATNLIPFLQNNQGNRTMTASRQANQAVGLRDRELPLVQVQGGKRSWEQIIGGPFSHASPVDGKVMKIRTDQTDNEYPDSIVLKGEDGKKHEVQLYNHFPLNDSKSFMHSDPVVAVGDEVKKGQVLADTNYTKDGGLALGTNLLISYLPYKGYNFEDGIVISDSAAKKLTSQHVYRKGVEIDPSKDFMNKKKFQAYASTTSKQLRKDQIDKLDDDGVIRVGQKVDPGDVLVAAVGKRENLGVVSRMASRLDRKLFEYADRSVRWDAQNPGTVVKVHKLPNGKGAMVHVRTEEPAEVGDKIVGRHGNKSIITQIIPDEEMPRVGNPDSDKHVEVLMNPSGVPSRINLGQMLETAASKIAKKTGKPYMVNNFGGVGVDYTEKVKRDLSDAGISDKEELFDPETKKKLGDVLTGDQYIMKLKHQVEKKLAVRSHGPNYSIDGAPKGTGAEHPGQGIGQLEFYSLLAHGARENLKEMATYKADRQVDENMNPQSHVDFWHRVQMGQPIPAPRSSFAYKKFEAYLKGLGIDTEKKGNEMQLVPLTDRGVLNLSNGEIKDPGRVLRGKDAKELEKGLFDPEITGGLPDPNEAGKGLNWSHISLAEPMPNPVFVGTPQKPGPAVVLSGLKFPDFEDIVKGKKEVDGKTGGEAIKHLLDQVDVKAELEKTVAELPNLRKAKLNHANRKAKYLRALKELGMAPSEAYVMNHVPVLPPVFRPIVPMPDGSLRFDDINHLYKDMGIVNNKLKDKIDDLPDTDQPLREELYDLLKATMGTGGVPQYESNRQLKGILDTVAGASPKQGFFQRRLMKRRQELSMRSTIIPEPEMHLDRVGIPRSAAMELYKPFVIRELKRTGRSPLQAHKDIKDESPAAWTALQNAMEARPVLLKRDPALHKFSFMAFKPMLVDGKAIRIHPLVTAGYNADFDGDSVDLDTPIPLRIRGRVNLKTGRELASLLCVEGGNYIAETRDIEAYTYNGWRPVKTVSFHEVKDKRKYRIKLNNGVEFIVSEDHSVMVGGEKCKPTSLVLGVELDHRSVKNSLNLRGDYAEGVIFGHFLGDGSAEILSRGSGRVSLACKPKEERSYLIDLWKRKFDAHVYGSEHGYFQITSKVIAEEFLEKCGRYSDRKFVGEGLLSMSPEALKGLLAGYILADGSVEITKSGSYLVRTWSRSKALRDGMSLVANMLGLPHSLRERSAKGKVNYIISFGKEAIKLIDYRCPGKKGDLIRQARYDYDNCRNDSRRSQSVRGFEISSIEEISYDDRMIDIEIDDESHVFAIHGGVIVHNTMSAFVPLTDKAVRESHKMFPSNNLFSSTHGGIMYAPEQESLLGLHLLSKWGEGSDKKFSAYSDAKKAFDRGSIGAQDVITVNGRKTTVGRLMLAQQLPRKFRDNKDLLHNPKFVLNKFSDPKDSNRVGVHDILSEIAREDPRNYANTVDRLKNLGNQHSYEAGFSIGLDDLGVDKATRAEILAKADDTAAKILASKLKPEDRDDKLIDIYTKATDEMEKKLKPRIAASGNNIFTMVDSGTRGKWSQFRQMNIAPMLMQDATGRTLPTPVRKSYSEGLDVGDYWTALHGARMGTLQRAEGTSEPGMLTKEIVNTVIPEMIVSKDCKHKEGISMGIHEEDVHGRFLAKPIKAGGRTHEAGSLITPHLTSQLKKNGVGKVVVRSPLKCSHGQGVCATCFGLNENGDLHGVGTNIGVISGHALGEPAMQLAMDSFHTGGVAGSRGAAAVSRIGRLKQLLNPPKKLPGSATLSKASGKVQKIERDKATQGWNVWVGGEKHYAPAQRKLLKDGRPLSVGANVKKGMPLTDGPINPRELLPLTDVPTVQNYLTKELYDGIYKDERVKRRNIEMVVRSLTNLAQVRDPGDSDYLSGDVVLRSVIEEENRKAKGAPVEARPIIKGLSQGALDQQEDWMARLNFRRLKETLMEGASKGWRTNIHGINPIPAYAYGAEFGEGTKNKPYLY